MQQLFDAGFESDPVSGLPVFDPSACTPALLESVWRSYCGVADTINTKELGGTGAALEGLWAHLLAHARLQPHSSGRLRSRPKSRSISEL